MTEWKVRRLTPAERDAAVLAAKAGDLEARNRLIEDSYQIMIRFLVRSGATFRHPRYELDNIKQDMVIAMCGAIDRLDLTRGDSPGKLLSTTMWWSFRGCYYNQLRNAKRRITLHTVGDDALDFLAPPDDAVEPSDSDHDKATVRRLIATLDPRSAHVVRLRFGIRAQPHTLEQVARKLGVSRERVRQIEKRAIRKLSLAARAMAG